MFGLATFAYLLAPPIIIALGAKWSITIGGVTYLIFMASFFYIRAWLLYLTSALLGFGAVRKSIVSIIRGSPLATIMCFQFFGLHKEVI